MMKLLYCQILEGKDKGVCTGMVERLDVEENYIEKKIIIDAIDKVFDINDHEEEVYNKMIKKELRLE